MEAIVGVEQAGCLRRPDKAQCILQMGTQCPEKQIDIRHVDLPDWMFAILVGHSNHHPGDYAPRHSRHDAYMHGQCNTMISQFRKPLTHVFNVETGLGDNAVRTNCLFISNDPGAVDAVSGVTCREITFRITADGNLKTGTAEMFDEIINAVAAVPMARVAGDCQYAGDSAVFELFAGFLQIDYAIGGYVGCNRSAHLSGLVDRIVQLVDAGNHDLCRTRGKQSVATFGAQGFDCNVHLINVF